MEISFTNSLSGKVEKFEPLKEGHAGLYVCGLTPYDSAHLGHGRAYVFFDIVRRTLEAAGYKVKHIQNFTDIDDKILERSKKEGISPILFVSRYIEEYFESMAALNVTPAHQYPRVTQYIPQIIKTTEKLIACGMAYAAPNGDVYYQTSKFKNYGKLSKKKLEDLIAGARVEVSPHKKEPTDFALWKSDTESSLTWKSPWSQGRPGWHIECSVMSYEHLGQPFDIHGGGEDLIFPHHENEIAQSEGPEGVPFARYFLHNGFITLNKEKMSKSLGNFFTLKDLLKQFDGRFIRYYLLSEHYRRPLDFSDKNIEEAGVSLGRLEEALQNLTFVIQAKGNGSASKPLKAAKGPYSEKVLKCLTQDFHTPTALAAMHEWASSVFTDFKAGRWQADNARETAQDALWAAQNLLGIPLKAALPEIPKAAQALIAQRQKMRAEKKFAEADALRKELTDKFKLLLEDTPYGPRLKEQK